MLLNGLSSPRLFPSSSLFPFLSCVIFIKLHCSPLSLLSSSPSLSSSTPSHLLTTAIPSNTLSHSVYLKAGLFFSCDNLFVHPHCPCSYFQFAVFWRSTWLDKGKNHCTTKIPLSQALF